MRPLSLFHLLPAFGGALGAPLATSPEYAHTISVVPGTTGALSSHGPPASHLEPLLEARGAKLDAAVDMGKEFIVGVSGAVIFTLGLGALTEAVGGHAYGPTWNKPDLAHGANQAAAPSVGTSTGVPLSPGPADALSQHTTPKDG